jgi:alkylated DNA nucleotide flippase Atl1
MKTRKSWREKLENPNLPKVEEMPQSMRKRLGTGTMLIPNPHDVEALIRTVPHGGLITVGRLRQNLAAKYAADVTCPLTTGIFVRIVAEAAEQEAREGKRRITPYWRVIKDNGSLNPKFPGGVESQAKRLREEGHTIDSSRKIPRLVGQRAAGV